MSSVLHGIARRAPYPAKRALYAGLEALDPAYRWLFAATRRATPPLPPMRLRARVGKARGIAKFLRTGRRCARAIEEAASSLGRPLPGLERVLDFGCGCGRTILGLGAPPAGGITGCDVDAECIEWCRRHLSGDFVVSDFAPPLPFSDGAFELVYSVSVLTHLDRERQERWLQELSRVLAPGGIALITVQGARAYELFRGDVAYSTRAVGDVLAARGALEEERFVHVPYDTFRGDGTAFPGVRDSYGLTFQSRAQLEAEWGRSFDVLRVDEAAVDDFQDLVVLRRRGAAPAGRRGTPR